MNNNFSGHFKRVFWILFFGLLLSTNAIYAQTGTVSVDFKNASPKEIIENLESRTPYRFVYQSGIDLDSPRVTLKKDNVSIDEILKELQALTGLNFKRNENNIAINKKDTSKKKAEGKIIGTVLDSQGLPLPGADVKVMGTDKYAQSDSDGNYSIELPVGIYTLQVTFLSYQTQNITGVAVNEDKATPLNMALKEEAQSLDEVVITLNYVQATESVEGMLLQQKKAAQFSDGISAEQIARTPDNNVGSTLKRITGVTTVAEKYVIVRSMGERWNQAVMDGINLPSTDPYQQSFSFDIIPTSMVESVVVSKTATPDMNANFAGGYIEVKTKSIPKENFTALSVGTGYNTRSTFKDQYTKDHGKYDYLGFDDGRRDYPAGLVHIDVPTTEAASGPFLEQSKQFTEDNFSTYKTNTPLNTNFQFGLGRVYELKDNNKWGFIGSISFRNTQSTLKIDHTERGIFKTNTYLPDDKENIYTEIIRYGYKNSGASYDYNTTISGMLNGGLQLGRHKFTMRNTLIHIYDSQLTQVTGWREDTPFSDIMHGAALPYTQETSYPIYQNFIQSKIEGSHPFTHFDVNWFAAYSNVNKETKDATFLDTYRDKVGDDVFSYNRIYNSGYKFPFGRANYTNNEDDFNFGANINWSLNFDTFKNDIKIGYFGTRKTATNQQESANLRALGETSVQSSLPISELLNGSYYHYGGLGWEVEDLYGNEYKGTVTTNAPFLMIDNKIGQVIRLVWGLRAESYVYKEISNQSDESGSIVTLQKDEKKWQYMPSAAITISPSNTTNIRFGYYKSVLRPQFSERIGTPIYDPIRSGMIINASGGLVSSVSQNYDFKVEWFPSQGQVMSFGVYGKNISDPIEGINTVSPDGIRNIFTMNSDSAKLWGVEAEILKNLDFLGEGTILKNLFIYANGCINDTKVTSYVNIDGTGGLYKANRPLFGQSPYSYNFGLDYTGERLGFSIRQNGSGDQYILVGFNYGEEEIRRPYSQTDAQVSYKLLKERNLEIKCSATNIFDRPIETYNNENSYKVLNENFEAGVSNPRDRYSLSSGATKRYDENLDNKLFKAWMGTTISLTLNYAF